MKEAQFFKCEKKNGLPTKQFIIPLYFTLLY